MMLCEICHKNEATIHMQEIHGGEKKSLNICSECAASHKIVGSDVDGLNLAEMLYDFSSKMLASQGKNSDDSALFPSFPLNVDGSLICGECGWDMEAFRGTGRLGCAKCYEVFAPLLQEAIASMHKGVVHVGKELSLSKKRSGRTSKRDLRFEIALLEAELEEHVRREEYEEAAAIRDKIKTIQAKIKTGRKRGKN